MRPMKHSRNRHSRTRKQKPVYGTDDYNSKDGMLTSVWGPGMWHYLHTMSFNYPVNPTKQQKEQYRSFVLSLQHVLPCGKCRTNLQKNFKKLPLTMKDMLNRETFSIYIYKLHELINTMLGKRSGLTYETVKERYEHFRARCALPHRNKTKKKLEKGCTEPLYGEKSKCILRIVPETVKTETLDIDEKCIKRRE